MDCLLDQHRPPRLRRLEIAVITAARLPKQPLRPFAALTRDVEALFYNPATLPLMEGAEARITMMPYFADTNYLWAGVALPLRGGEIR